MSSHPFQSCLMQIPLPMLWTLALTFCLIPCFRRILQSCPAATKSIVSLADAFYLLSVNDTQTLDDIVKAKSFLVLMPPKKSASKPATSALVLFSFLNIDMSATGWPPSLKIDQEHSLQFLPLYPFILNPMLPWWLSRTLHSSVPF